MNRFLTRLLGPRIYYTQFGITSSFTFESKLKIHNSDISLLAGRWYLMSTQEEHHCFFHESQLKELPMLQSRLERNMFPKYDQLVVNNDEIWATFTTNNGKLVKIKLIDGNYYIIKENDKLLWIYSL